MNVTYHRAKRNTPSRSAPAVLVHFEPPFYNFLQGIATYRQVSVSALCEALLTKAVHFDIDLAAIPPAPREGLPR